MGLSIPLRPGKWIAISAVKLLRISAPHDLHVIFRPSAFEIDRREPRRVGVRVGGSMMRAHLKSVCDLRHVHNGLPAPQGREPPGLPTGTCSARQRTTLWHGRGTAKTVIFDRWSSSAATEGHGEALSLASYTMALVCNSSACAFRFVRWSSQAYIFNRLTSAA